MRSYVSAILASSAIAVTLGASAARAQEAGATAESDNSAEIIVTAQRRPESLQKVPVSVNVVSASALNERNINSVQQLSLAAPSLQLGGDNTFAVRGVGTLAFQQTVDPAVAFAVDEVNLARTVLTEGVFNDVAQIEVLNGPQGLLFGKNATAGLLNMTTKKPVLNQRSLDGDIEYDVRDTTPGDSHGVIARTAVNLPVGNTSALRVALAYEFQNPVTRVVAFAPGSDFDRRAFDAKVKYLFQPTDNFSLYAIANYAKLTGGAGLWDRTYRTLAPGSANIAPLAADGFIAGPNLLEYKADGVNYRRLENYGGQLNGAYTTDSGLKFTDVIAYRGYNLDQTSDLDFTSSNADSKSAGTSRYHQFSNEFRVALPDTNPLSGQFGLYYMNFKDQETAQNAGNLYLPGFLLPNPPFCVNATVSAACPVSRNFAVGSDSNYVFKSESYAAFSQLTYAVTDQFKLIAGGRVTHDAVSIDLTQNQLQYFVRFGGPAGHYVQSASNTDFSWKVGAQYQVTPDVMLYSTYAKGYKGPGMNSTSATTTADLQVKPETSRNLELGIKSSWLDRKLTLNLALFQTRYRDYQASGFDPILSAFVVRNAAKLNSKGAEISFTARPSKAFTVNGSVSLLDSKFGDFPGAQCYPQQGCTTFNAAGLRSPLAAKFTSSLGASYTLPIGANSLTLSGDWYHRSSIFFLANNNPLASLGPVNVFGARLTYAIQSNVKVSVFCKNCTDERVPSFIGNDPGDANGRPPLNSVYQAFGFNSVRTIGAGLGFNF